MRGTLRIKIMSFDRTGKTFRELKDTELIKQMDEQELQSVFNGELSFEEETELEVPAHPSA